MIQEELLPLDEELDSDSDETLFFLDSLRLFLFEERSFLFSFSFSLSLSRSLTLSLSLYLSLSRSLSFSLRLSRTSLPRFSVFLRLSFSRTGDRSFFSICFVFVCLFSLGLFSRFSSSGFSSYTLMIMPSICPLFMQICACSASSLALKLMTA